MALTNTAYRVLLELAQHGQRGVVGPHLILFYLLPGTTGPAVCQAVALLLREGLAEDLGGRTRLTKTGHDLAAWLEGSPPSEP